MVERLVRERNVVITPNNPVLTVFGGMRESALSPPHHACCQYDALDLCALVRDFCAFTAFRQNAVYLVQRICRAEHDFAFWLRLYRLIILNHFIQFARQGRRRFIFG